MPGKPSKANRSIERAIDVLLALAKVEQPVSVLELERLVNLNRPTLYRILHTLNSRGMVTSSAEPQRFRLGSRAVELARPWLGGNRLRSLAQPYLNELWEGTDETVALFVPGDGDTKVCIQELQSRQALVFTRGTGIVEPLIIGSSGKSILAFQEAETIRDILATIDGDRNRALIERDLVTIRKDGYSLTEGEVIAGAVAISAPIFDRTGSVQASVSLYGPATRLSGEHKVHCLDYLLQTSCQISAAMGYQQSSMVD